MRTVLLLAVIVALLARNHLADDPPACVSTTSSLAVAPAPPAPPAPVAEVPLAVTADEMQFAYSANEISADDRYRNRLLDITGGVQAIKKTVIDTPYLVLQIAGDPRGVQATFHPAFSKVLARVAKGDSVRARCRGDGTKDGTASARSCVLLEQPYRQAADSVTDDYLRSWPWE